MSEFSNTYKISEELAEKIRKEAAEAARRKKDIAQEFDAYLEFVENQKKYFLEDIDTILNILTNLIMEGKLFIHTKLVARIKDPESAVHNDDFPRTDKENLMGIILSKIDESDYTVVEIDNEKQIKHKSKKLDDVFGIAVITDTQEEIDILKEELKKQFNVHNEKRKDKAQYHAIHMELFGKKDEESPLVECQLKTRQHYIDSYDHTLYKVESNLARKLYNANVIDENRRVKLNENGIKKVERSIQEFYDNGRFSIFRNVPRMWEATFNEENEEMELKRLTEAQTLKRVYPSLVIRSDKSR